MLSRFQTGSTPQEQLRHLYALTEFDDEGLILRTCEFAMSDAVKTQNAPFVLRQAIANRRHGAAAWGSSAITGTRPTNGSRPTRSCAWPTA